MPRHVTAMLVEEVIDRLGVLATAIERRQTARHMHERARIEAILKSLASADDGMPGSAGAHGTLYRSVDRMVALAVMQHDPARCRQGVALLRPLARFADDVHAQFAI